MSDINEVNGNPAIETDEPISIQEANEWAPKVRAKADSKKDIIERLRCAAAKRRERSGGNPIKTKDSEISYRAKGFNPESDAFDIESSDGKKLLGKSLSNGNVKNGQKVRSFFDPNGRVVIDVKPKGRDIIILKPVAAPPVEDPDIWPVTSCFLYTRIKGVTEKLTGNGAAQGIEETSWGSMRAYSNNTGNAAYGFAERLDDLGNYKTAEDALNNKLRPECLIVPTGGGSPGAAKDDLVGSSGSGDAVIVWFYIGELNNTSETNLVDTDSGEIFQVLGRSQHPENINIEQGPGFCMQMMSLGTTSLALYPIVSIGLEPLTQYLKLSFPDLGGRIGYWGNIFTWRGMQDYSTSRTSLFRDYSPVGTPQTPTSYPPEWNSSYPLPWIQEDSTWYRYGWNNPNNRIACLSGGAIVVTNSALTPNAGFLCGDKVANDKWGWSLGVGVTRGALEYEGFYSRGMFVCWEGHKDHIGMAQSFFEVFRIYWKIPGGVKKLRSCNLYGCEILGDGDGDRYPSPPPSDARRFLVDAYGRKAKVLLACHKQDFEPIELELPFEYAAVVEEMRVLGGGSFSTWTNFETGKVRKFINTYGAYNGFGSTDPFSLDLIHGSLSIDAEFAYVDIFYGGERLYEEPKTFPIPIQLASQGYGTPSSGFYGNDSQSGQRLGLIPTDAIYPSGWPQTPAQTGERHPRYVKDCWSCCQSYKIKLPTKDDKTLTIVASQKYKRGESINITANNPDNEFNNKFLIRDYRTDDSLLSFKPPNSDYASFGGLPALHQQRFLNSTYTNNDIPITGVFYKNKQDWTIMDWIHYQLQEMPRQYNPLVTVLSPGVSIQVGGTNMVNMINDLDKKFGRHGRAEKIMTASSFGYSGSFSGGQSPAYVSQGQVSNEDLHISHKEQLIGNGLIKNGVIKEWYRVTTSSFPILGQLLRNTV
ncbi:MAG: hypothetical protein EAZ18_00230 [Oscillatoriales cyanobacterium]|nr:MAG: hypothetical protein EAZ18_00230 [Oscillatoriales cyanobacterium]